MERLLLSFGGEAAVMRALTVGLLVAARIAPAAGFAPFLAMRRTPAVVRTGIILALTLSLAPGAIHAAAGAPLPPAHVPLLAVREALLGLVLAIAVAVPLYGLDWAGRLIDTWRGASLSQIMAPATGERTSPLGNLLLLLGVALFATLGGYRLLVRAFAETLAVAPVGGIGLGGGAAVLALGTARLVAGAVALAMAFAAPAAVALITVELTLGLVGRAAPQVPVFFLGMPVRAAVGLAALLLGLSVLVGQLPALFRGAVAGALRLVE